MLGAVALVVPLALGGGLLVRARAVPPAPSLDASVDASVDTTVDTVPTATTVTPTAPPVTRPATRQTSTTSTTTTTTTTTTAAAATVPTLPGYSGPPGALPPDPATCPATAHGAVVDRELQRGWLCENGAITYVFPITTAISQPDPGEYPVYARDEQTRSRFGERPSTLDRFVAFTRGKYSGARIAFHAIPRFDDGTLAQPPEAIGALAWRGESAGCIRVLPDDAVRIWDWLQLDDVVHVVN
jgi:lipoprotein-anchoring transpeptidase ErfK/SrfK